MGGILLVSTGAVVALGAWIALKPRGGIAAVLSEQTGPLDVLLSRLSQLGAHIPREVLGVVSPWPVMASEFVRCAQESTWHVAKRLTPEAALVLVACVPVLGALTGVALSHSWLGIPAGIFAAVALLALWQSRRARQRKRQLEQQVPDVFRSLSGALSSGKTLAQAVSYVSASGSGPLYQEFGRASLLISCGSSATDALAELPQRVEAPGVSLMVTALSVSARTGAPLQGLFTRAARLVERRFELERELSAKTAQVRLSSHIVSILPLAMVCLLTLLSPDYRTGIAMPVGTGCVAVAAVLDLVALLAIRRLMKGVI